MSEFKVGDHVEVTGKGMSPQKGEIAFIGATDFQAGKWIGVKLPEPKGKNDGSVQGKSYFSCKPKHGLFVRQNQVTLIESPVKKKVPAAAATGAKTTDDGENSAIPRSGLPRPSGIPGSGLRAPTASRLSMLGAGRTAPKGLGAPKTPLKKSTDDVQKSLAKSGSSTPLSKSSSAASSVEGSSATPKAPTTTTPSKPPAKKTPSKDKQGAGAVGPASDKKLEAAIKDKEKEAAELRSTVQDLEEKMAILTAKRAEDKAKIKEMEKYKLQITQFADYKKEWSSAQGDLHEQLKASKKEAKESTEARTKAEAELDELRERVEEMALDKEMAEEMKECAELELEKVKEQYDEAKQELDLMKQEITTGGGGSVDNVKIKHMEMQTAQLKEAVIKLKELNTQDRKEIETLTAQLTKEQAQVGELSKLRGALEEELEEHETMVTELTEQVECGIGAEAMVEKLTDRNLELEDDMKTMAEKVTELEALREIYEELEEERMVTERELREELDISRNKHYQYNKKVEELTEQNTDLQHVIMQFRSYVNQLQAQLKDTQQQMSQEKEATEGVDEDRLQQFAQMQAQLQETKAAAAAPISYDADFVGVEVHESLEEVRLLKLFFPERFTAPGSDYEALRLILTLEKLAMSSEVVGRVTSKHLKLGDVLAGEKITPLQYDKAVYAAGLVLELGLFQVAVSSFQRCIKQCDADTFLRLGRLASDLGPHMAMLATFRAHLDKGTLDETVSIDPVVQSTGAFQTLRTTYFADIQPSCRELLSDDLMIMQLACEGLIASADKICVVLARVQEGGSVAERVIEIRSRCTDYLKTFRRIKNFVPAQGKPFSFPAEVDEMLTGSLGQLSNCFTVLQNTANALSMHVAGAAEDDVVTLHDISDLIKKGCSGVEGTGAGFDRIKSHLDALLPPLQQMAKNLQDGDYDQRGNADTKSEPPYDIRAKIFKEQFSLADQLKAQLEYKNSENHELKKMVKMKGEEVSQQSVKAEMLERRLENARKDGDTKLEAMKKEIADGKKTISEKDKQFEETMDQLQEDINSLESEKANLKVKLEQANKRAPRTHLTESILAEQASGQPGSVRVIVEDSPATLSKLESLQNYAKLVQDENVKLMANSLKAKLAALPPLVVPTTKRPEVQVEKPVNELHQKLLSIIANTKVIDITKTTNGKTPAEQLAEQRATEVCLHNECLKLKLQAQKELGRYYGAGGFIKTDSGEFITPEFSRVIKEKENPRMYGKITIPAGKSPGGGLYKIMLSNREINSLNAKLLPT